VKINKAHSKQTQITCKEDDLNAYPNVFESTVIKHCKTDNANMQYLTVKGKGTVVPVLN
jgi:hypothetical protein